MPNSNQQSFPWELTKYKFDPKRPVPVPTPILSLKGVPLCTPGNISNIQGPPKSAKSSVMGAVMASILRAITGKGADLPEETLGFSSGLKANDGVRQSVVLHFDTEQSPYHHHKLCFDVLQRAGIEAGDYDTLPFHSYSLIQIDHHLRKGWIEKCIGHFTGNQQSLACLFLDGVADVISDPNNAEESFGIVDWLHRIAAHHQCAVITILHENPDKSGKARGHLGSQIIRKSETNLRVRKDGSRGKDGKTRDEHVSLIWVEHARGAHIPEMDGVKISWSKHHKRHLIHDPARQPKNHEREEKPPEAPRSAKLTKAEERTQKWLEETLTHPLAHKDLVKRVETRENCGERTAKERIKTWTHRGWIHKQAVSASAPYALGPKPAERIDSPEPESAKPQASKGSKKPGVKPAQSNLTKEPEKIKPTADGGNPSQKQPKATNPKTRKAPSRNAQTAKEAKGKPASSTSNPRA